MSDSGEFSLFSSSILFPSNESTNQSDVPLSKPNYAYESLVEGCYNQFHDTNFKFTTTHKLETAQKWIEFGGKHQVKFPLQTLLPKVQMIRQVAPKQLPRAVEVDRHRRSFEKVRISQLLLEAGIPIAKLIQPEKFPDEPVKMVFERSFFYPLHIFDDESFDSNSISGWLNMGLVEDERHPLPAWALIRNGIGYFTWEMVAVYEYDEITYLFTVVDLGEGQTHQIYRIHLMFMAESPYLFVERIKHALTQRTLSEARIRYEIMLDCAMYEGVPDMDQALLSRILKISLGTDNTSSNGAFIQSVAQEIQLNFQRVMISYEFESLLQSHGDDFRYVELPRKDRSIAKQVLYCSVRNDRLRFENARQMLRVITLFYVAESIKGMLNAAAECVHIESFCLFQSIFTKPVTLTDFVIAQENNCSTVVKYLNYVWPENMSGKICLCLRSIGKGWLDLSVSDWNVFSVSKLSRFLIQVKFRMQESLQMLLEKSILKYSQLLNDPCADFLQLDETYRWTSDFKSTPFDRPNLPPIFKLTLHLSADGPFYSTNPDEFEPTLTKLLYTSLMSTCSIRMIDPEIVLKLNYARNLCIYTVELIEEKYFEHVGKLHTSYAKAVIPLNAYLRTYDRFVEFHELSVDKYIQEFSRAEKSSQEVKNEIIWQKEQKNVLREILPDDIVIGSFQIIVEPLKNNLVNKRIEIIRRLFLYYVDRMFNTNERLLEELLEINGRLHQKLVSIEHLFEIKDYMTMVPDKLVLLREKIQIMMLEYSLLDSFFYNLTDQQFAMKWEAFAWPYKISKRLVVMKEEHKNDIEEFKRIHIRELVTFQDRLGSLNEEIMTYSLQFDPNKALKVAVEAKKTWKTITDLQDLGTVLQDRQGLFEAEPLSLDYLETICENFTPYRKMWSACSDFIKLEEIAFGNPLTTIDLNEVRENLAELKRILHKSAEFFQEREEVQNVAIAFQGKIEEFHPIVDTIACVKNEHWLVMHWEELSLKSGIDIKFSIAMNFAYCIKKGILKHITLVKEIAERAVLEADAIRFAMEEEKRLRREAELVLLEKKLNRKCRTDIL